MELERDMHLPRVPIDTLENTAVVLSSLGICVLILLYMCPHTTVCVLILLCMCLRTTKYLGIRRAGSRG